MKCLFCITELPVDSNTLHIICPKCGSEFDVIHATGQTILLESEQDESVLDLDEINRQIEEMGIGTQPSDEDESPTND